MATRSGNIVSSQGIIVNNFTGATGYFKNLITSKIGLNAGETVQGVNSIAIGTQAGQYNQGTDSIAIGYLAGPTGMTKNSIVLNSSGTGLYGTGPIGGFYVAPIADSSSSTGGFKLLAYGPDNQIVSITGTALTSLGVGGGGGSVTGFNLGTGGTGFIWLNTLSNGPTGTDKSILLNASGKNLYATGPTGGFYVAPIVSLENSTGPFKNLVYGADNQIVSVTGPTSTITFDSWILANLINSPPATTLTIKSFDTNNIYINFTYPSQIMWGYSNNYLPLLTGFNVNLYTGGNYNNTNGSSAISQSANFIKTSSTDNTIITFIHITNVSTTTGYNNGIYGPEYVIYIPSILTTGLTNSYTGKIWAWYNNYNTNYNISQALLINYLQSVPPGSVSNITVTYGTTSNTYNLSITFISPSSSGVTSPSLTYNITFTPASNTIRYPGLYNTTSVNSSGSINAGSISSGSIQRDSLLPDTGYNVSITTTNASSLTGDALILNYSTGSTIGFTPQSYFITSNPSFTYTLPSGINSFSAKAVISGTYTILSGNPSDNFITGTKLLTGSVIFNIQNCYETRGKIYTTTISSTDYLLNVNFSLSGGSLSSIQTSSTIYLGTFNQTSFTTSVNNNITITSTRADNFSNEISGFYEKGTFTFSIPYNTTNFPNIPISSNPYTITVNGTYPALNTPGRTSILSLNPSLSSIIYWDGIFNTPSISGVTFTVLSSTSFLSGLSVYSRNLTISITTNSIKNLGNYYYNNTQILSYVSSIGGTMPSETDLTNVTTGISGGLINNTTGITVTVPSTTITSPTSTYSNSLYITTIAYNIASTNALLNSSTKTLIYDQSSKNFEDVLTINKIENALNGYRGYRLWSVYSLTSNQNSLGNEANNPTNKASNLCYYNGSTYQTFASQPYMNSKSLLDDPYKYELLYADGLYRTDTTYNINYSSFDNNNLNYSTLNNNTLNGYKYTTFCWQIQAKSFGFIYFTLNNTNYTPTSNPATTTVNVNGSQLYLYYRIEDPSKLTNISNNTIPVSKINTPWINGTNIANNNVNGTNIDSSTLLLNGLSSLSSSTFKVTTVTTLTGDYSNTLNIYCRVGIPVSSGFNFSSIFAYTSM